MKSSQALNRLSPNRRGITLLFVISMIVLFLLMGTTFVVVSNDYLKAARRRGNNNLVRDPGRPLLERAFYELVRGPSLRNTTSPLRGHSLLADLYGYGYKAEVETAFEVDNGTGTDPTDGQFFEIHLRAPNNGARDQGESIRDGVLRPFSAADEKIDDAYNGMLLTFTTGNAAGLTARIVDYRNTGATVPRSVFRLAPVWSSDDVFDPNNLAGLAGAEVIINGMPFGGTGAGGYTAGTPINQPALSDEALNPDRRGDSFDDLVASPTSMPPGLGFLSNDNAPNEPWDAPDHQNMFLAFDNGVTTPISSFYRRYAGGSFGSFREFSSPDRGVLIDNDGDGVNDGIWMDIGLSVQTDSSGRYIKPLVSYKVIDMGGRVNINAAGSLADTDPSNFGYMTADTFLNGTAGQTTDTLPRGVGYGPPEISMRGILDTEYRAVLQEKYGTDNVPGAAGRDDRSRDKLFGFPTADVTANGTRGRLFVSSAADPHGRFAIGSLSTTTTGHTTADSNNPGFPNGLPGIDLQTSNLNTETLLNTEIGNSPYEMNFAMAPFGDYNDSPFSPQEFERLLRTQDRDVYMLPQRLWDIAQNAFEDASDAVQNRNAVTTESWSIPTLPVSQAGLILALANKLADERGTDASDEFGNAKDMLPSEFLVGLKMNVNRPFGNGVDDDGDGLVDEPGETHRDFDNNNMNGFSAQDKSDFAQQLYVLALLLGNDGDAINYDFDLDGTDGGTIEYRKTIAQWCANVVDFRDPDSIMTTVEFDSNPFDDVPVDGDLTTDEGVARLVIRGLERPELLLTEGLAFHDRRTENIDGGDGVHDGDESPDPTYDNRLRPQASAFIELYNPWTQNDFNQKPIPELYGTGTGVDLAKVSVAGSPVWRVTIARTADEDEDQELLRAVYFVDDFSAIGDTTAIDVFYPSLTTINVVEPGKHAVIGTGDPNMTVGGNGYRTTLGRRNTVSQADEPNSLQLDRTRSITLLPDSNQVLRTEWSETSTSMVDTSIDDVAVVVIDSPRPFNISDPTGGYPDQLDSTDPRYQSSSFIGDGYAYDTVQGDPVDLPADDTDPQAQRDYAATVSNGTYGNYREVQLQRLADPTQAWDAMTNPYVTIDRLPIALQGFNGIESNPTNGASTPSDPGGSLYDNQRLDAVFDLPTDFRSYELGFQRRTLPQPDERRMLWNDKFFMEDIQRGDETDAQSGTFITAMDDEHNVSFRLEESLGETNDWYTDTNAFDDATDPIAFPWLQFNNRPYASHLELANVPVVGPEDIGRQFSIEDTSIADVTTSFRCPYGHLPNVTNTVMDLFRVFDFLEVPSRFVGTEQVLNRTNFDNAPFNYLPRYRVPGKININTISNGKVWSALMREFATIDGGLTFGSFQSSLGVNTPTSFPEVFKPGHAANYRSQNEPYVEPVDCGLFRRDGTDLMFDYNPATELAYNNTERSPYFRNQMRQRLGNLVTNHSNVFAIWITIGYFEYDPTELDPAVASSHYGAIPDLDDANDYESEVGYDMGLIKRSRAFYIFDRSIPMGFEPGKNHNVDRGVLVKSIIDE